MIQEINATITQKQLCDCIRIFLNDAPENTDLDGRFRSWEHCYAVFGEKLKHLPLSDTGMDGVERYSTDVDFLAVHLAFYLASWGMYRGSSFLLQKDYSIHKEPIRLIAEKYAWIYGQYPSNPKAVSNLYSALDKLYRVVVRTKQGEEKERIGSPTLLTKIMLGTLGCIPAFDRYLKSALSHVIGLAQCPQNLTKKNIEKVVVILNDYTELSDFKNLQKEFSDFPPMKLLDVGLWAIGYTLDTTESKEDPKFLKQLRKIIDI